MGFYYGLVFVTISSWAREMSKNMVVASNVHHGSCELPSILGKVGPYPRCGRRVRIGPYRGFHDGPMEDPCPVGFVKFGSIQ